MREPTEEQIKKFWEWCGIKEVREYREVHSKGDDLSGTYHFWKTPDGSELSRIPPIDLNSLFEYASQHFISMACGNINEPEWKGAWAKVITHERETSHIWEAGLTPALALFWAIYKVMEA